MWDTAGQEKFRAITKSYYKGAVAALLVYDITDSQSFRNAIQWLGDLKEHGSDNLVVMLVGNKSDLGRIRAVSTEKAKAFAEEQKISFMETSALDSTNIEMAFRNVVSILITDLDSADSQTPQVRPRLWPSKHQEDRYVYQSGWSPGCCN